MIEKNQNRLFLLFTALYFVQGVIQAYQLNFFKPHMVSEGIDPDRIGLVATLALVPFIIKAIFGLISDRISLFGFGHRVPYMMLGVTVCAVAFGVAWFVDPSANFVALAGIVLLATFFMALFDTVADAYAVDEIPPEDHSRVQSFMTGGRAAGLIVLSFIFGIVADRFGFNAIFPVIALCLLLPLILLFRVKEPAKRKEHQQFDWSAFSSFRNPAVLLFALFLIVAWTTFQGIDGLVTLYMSDDLGASTVAVGNYGTLKGIGMVLGAVGTGIVVGKFGRMYAAILTVLFVTIGGFLFSTLTDINLIQFAGILWGIVVGFHWTVYATVSMSITDTRVAGSMFAILQTMANIGIGVGDGLTVALTDNLPTYGAIFRMFALINLLALPLIILFFMRYTATREKLFVAENQ